MTAIGKNRNPGQLVLIRWDGEQTTWPSDQVTSQGTINAAGKSTEIYCSAFEDSLTPDWVFWSAVKLVPCLYSCVHASAPCLKLFVGWICHSQVLTGFEVEREKSMAPRPFPSLPSLQFVLLLPFLSLPSLCIHVLSWGSSPSNPAGRCRMKIALRWGSNPNPSYCRSFQTTRHALWSVLALWHSGILRKEVVASFSAGEEEPV